MSGMTAAPVLAGSITNDHLAGSITQDKIASLPTSKLTGTVTDAQLAGSISNDKLAGSITAAKLSSNTASLAGSMAVGQVAFTLNPYAFFPMLHASSINDSGLGTTDETLGVVMFHTTDGASPDAPRFIVTGDVKWGGTYDVDYRYLT